MLLDGEFDMTMTTPTAITEEIRRFCKSLVPGEDAVWVTYEPTPGAELESCYENVARLKKERGGTALLGWIIWEWPGVALQAEFHSVWRSDDGSLRDPTPKEDGERTILFLPDTNATDEGGIVSGQYLGLCDWQEVADYIAVCQENERLRRDNFRRLGGIPSDVWDSCLLRRRQASDAISKRLARQGLAQQGVIPESEAEARFSQSAADVEASTSLARQMAARGEFRQAFEVLIRTAEISQQKASEVRETIVALFGACPDESMVNDFRRRFTTLLY
jgi:hypothetical protein